MKRFAFSLIILLALAPSSLSASVTLGDADRDGVLTLADAEAVARVVVGFERRGSIHPVAADVNCDREVTMTDVLLIAQFVTSGQAFPC